jgi:hypothetical protein
MVDDEDLLRSRTVDRELGTRRDCLLARVPAVAISR